MSHDAPVDVADWAEYIRQTLSQYTESLLRRVALHLIKPRNTQPVEDLIERILEGLGNPPLVDRRLRDLPPGARHLITLIGLSRQPWWRTEDLLTFVAAVGDSDGPTLLFRLLEMGLLYPHLAEGMSCSDFPEWLGSVGLSSAWVFIPPTVADRARSQPLELPGVADLSFHEVAEPGRISLGDGWDWPLRLAALWQQIQASPVRITQSRTIFKRDLARLEADRVINTPLADQGAALPDQAILSLFWALATKLLRESEGELRANPFPPSWHENLSEVLKDLLAGLFRIDGWDPLLGNLSSGESPCPFRTAGLLTLLLISAAPAPAWVSMASVAEWLWVHHPSWSGTIPAGQHESRGQAWVVALVRGLLQPLQMVETSPTDEARLTALGRAVLGLAPEPSLAAIYPQTLLVQPNAEILVYRQGLSPALLSRLTQFARWKQIGAACTLELDTEQLYRGLEAGLTLPMVFQTLNQHGMKPVPPSVMDLLQRWANKRERVSVYPSATLVEFTSAADLDAAIARGIVTVKLTDRIGMTADGREPSFTQLRLIGNRDYSTPPQQCVSVGADGVSLMIDVTLSDLLVEAELVRLAEPEISESGGPRRYRLTRESLRRAVDSGYGIAELDAWFESRTGHALPPAARLFLLDNVTAQAASRLVLQLPYPEIAEGLMQWPHTNTFIEDRLGPTALAINKDRFQQFRTLLRELGISIQGEIEAEGSETLSE